MAERHAQRGILSCVISPFESPLTDSEQTDRGGSAVTQATIEDSAMASIGCLAPRRLRVSSRSSAHLPKRLYDEDDPYPCYTFIGSAIGMA